MVKILFQSRKEREENDCEVRTRTLDPVQSDLECSATLDPSKLPSYVASCKNVQFKTFHLVHVVS